MAIGALSQRQPSISRVSRARQKLVSRKRVCKRSRRWSSLSGMPAPPLNRIVLAARDAVRHAGIAMQRG
jgi:hypothetical protein